MIKKEIVMAKITFEIDKCKGCGLCAEACPKSLLFLDKSKINKKGHNSVAIKDMSKCVGCGFCFAMCPDSIITVEK